MHGPECRYAPRTRSLEEEKPFAARQNEFIRQLRNIRQVAALKGGHRILDKQGAGLLFSKLFTDNVECGLKLKRPATRVVSVAGHEVHQSVGRPAPSVFLRSRAKDSCERSCRHLYEATEPDPFRKPFRL